MKNILSISVIFLLFIYNLFPQKVGNSFRLNINNINLPLDRNGVIAHINIPPGGSGGKFGGQTFLFSSGFYLSGYSNGLLWANGVASAALVKDYISGIVSSPNNPDAVMYLLKDNDPHFGQSWQDWRDAVYLGADFYDGDGDSIYNPIDKNLNDVWDSYEDAPDILGDVTVWCVYNDGVPAVQRRWNTVEPIGIEIRQTVFAYTSSDLSNIIFLRYRIKYVGLLGVSEPDKLDDVYFGVWSDPDLGSSNDDLVGCDTSFNSSFTYNDGSDNVYGSNPPSFLKRFLSGPTEYIPGITFNDINENGIYDDGIDEPLDTAYIMRGQRMGMFIKPGARNQPLSSFIASLNSFSSELQDPTNPNEARNNMVGLITYGWEADPCTFNIGEVRGGIDCSTVDSKFWFSGDPVTNIGWIHTQPWDVRQLANTGPFTLNKNEEKEIIIAYVVGQGDDALTSITESKSISNTSNILFNSNFDASVVSVNDNSLDNIPNEFSLEQNYPNPFNPSTNIEFQIKEYGFVSLKIFDLLGNEVANLVDGEKSPGKYKIEFDASKLTSGIYFYKLKTADFSETKKLVLLK